MKQKLRNTIKVSLLSIVAMLVIIFILRVSNSIMQQNQSEETLTVSPVRLFLLKSIPVKTFSSDGIYISNEFEIYGLVEEVALKKDEISKFTVYDEFGNKIAFIDKENVDEMLIYNVKTVIRPTKN